MPNTSFASNSNPSISHTAQSGQSKPATVLVFGDSLSSGYGIDINDGWVQLLKHKLTRRGDYSVINASLSGETTSGGLVRLPRQLEMHKPDIVILELGGNDGLQGQNLSQLKSNLLRMVRLVQDNHSDAILLGMRIPPNYGRRYTEAFHATFKQVAQTTNIPIVDFFLDGVGGIDTYMQGDGIHPNTDAQAVLLNNVWPTLILHPLIHGSAATTNETNLEP